MKIGIDARMYGPQMTTGIGTYIKELTTELFLLDQKNHYTLFLNDSVYQKLKNLPRNVTIVKANLPWYSWSEQLKLPSMLLSRRLDLVHFPHFNAAIGYPKKFIVTIHDTTPMRFLGPRVRRSPLRRLGYKAVFSQGIKKASQVITVSHHTKKNIRQYVSVDEKKISVIYLGYREKFHRITDQHALAEMRKSYGINKPFLLFVGVWRDHKNITGLVEAFTILKKDRRLDLQLVLAGSPDQAYPEIQQRINAAPYRADIITPGFIPDEHLPLLYSAASLLVIPSFCEGFGLVALEALACGTPVVGSQTTSLPEIIQDAGVYFEPREPEDIAATIKNLLNDAQRYQKLQQKGKIIIKRYSWRSCAEKTLDIYQSASTVV